MGNNQSVNLERIRRRPSAVAIVPTLSESDMEMLVTKTHMTRDEVKEYYSKFCTNTHGSNIITRQVFSEIMHKCFPRTFKEELETDIFSLYDVNGSGFIEFSEFLMIVTVMIDGNAQTKLKQIFRIFDSDKNGSISRLELLSIVKHLFHLVPHTQKEDLPTPQKLSDKLMEEMDSDKDGVISEDEFILAFLRNEQITTNVINKIMTRFTSAKSRILED